MATVVIIEIEEGALPLLFEYQVVILDTYEKSSTEERAAIYEMKELTKQYRIERAKLTDKLDKIRENETTKD